MIEQEQFVIRPLEAEELEQAAALADHVFRDDGRKSMKQSLPQVFSTSLKQGIGCFYNKRLVSFAGLVPAIVRVHGVKVTAYSYGAVCTDPEFRGLGIASTVLTAAKDFVIAAQTSLLFVSGDLPIYIKAGMRYFGHLYRYRAIRYRNLTITNEQRNNDCSITYRKIERTDWLSLYKLAQQRPVAFEQSIWDMADLVTAGAVAAIRNWEQHVFIISDGLQEVGYIVLAYDGSDQRGERKGQVIEWAGTTPVIQLVITELVEQYDLTQVEWHTYEQVEELEIPNIQFQMNSIRNEGTVYICNAWKLFEELHPLFQQLVGADGWIPQVQAIDEELLYIQIGPYQSEPMYKEELPQHIFGDGVDQVAEDEGYQRQASRFFPVPLPYTKGLNFI